MHRLQKQMKMLANPHPPKKPTTPKQNKQTKSMGWSGSSSTSKNPPLNQFFLLTDTDIQVLKHLVVTLDQGNKKQWVQLEHAPT